MENLNLNLPPFYVGQKVVAIATHSKGCYSKGTEYTVLGVKKDCCYWVIDFGYKNTKINHQHCGLCGKGAYIVNGIFWFSADRFAPIEERFISFAEVIEIESPLIGAN